MWATTTRKRKVSGVMHNDACRSPGQRMGSRVTWVPAALSRRNSVQAARVSPASPDQRQFRFVSDPTLA
eukprot:251-Eustigmatos_ZCMA.PRE.1